MYEAAECQLVTMTVWGGGREVAWPGQRSLGTQDVFNTLTRYSYR